RLTLVASAYAVHKYTASSLFLSTRAVPPPRGSQTPGPGRPPRRNREWNAAQCQRSAVERPWRRKGAWYSLREPRGGGTTPRNEEKASDYSYYRPPSISLHGRRVRAGSRTQGGGGGEMEHKSCGDLDLPAGMDASGQVM